MTTQKPSRKARIREMTDEGTIKIRRAWNRTISASDLKRYGQCQAMYLMRAEHESEINDSVSAEVGELVHAESVKPVAERSDSAKLAESITTVTDPAQKQQIVTETQQLIAVSTAAQAADSKDAKSSAKELTMEFYDAYTNTTWFAKPDSMDVKADRRGNYLLVVDQKAGRYRSKKHMTGAFYLRDWQGNILSRPDEFHDWIGRTLRQDQDQMLQGIQAEIKVIEKDWERGEFQTKPGKQCGKCPFRESCPAGIAWAANEEEEKAARQLELEKKQAQDALLLRAKLEAACTTDGTEQNRELNALTALGAAATVNVPVSQTWAH
jgi:CRISPR/Cas system-associated exonuclease Cas4 (RecB family)